MNPPPDFPYAQLQSAVERQNHGDLAAAQSIYWDILVDHPTQFDALHLLGVTKCQEGRQTEGAWFIQRALEQRPDEPLALFNLGMALSDLHRPREATQLFDRVLAHEPGNPQAWFNRGNALQKQHQHAAAIESYQRALALQPNMPGTLFNMGTALAAIGDTAAAIGLFTQAMEHGADRASCLIGVGKALDEQGDRAGARKCYSDACDSAPDLAEPRWLLALSCLPIIPDGKSEIQQSREMLPAALDGLAAWYDHDTTGRRDRTMFGWPFYLAYQARNNRALMCRFGELRYRLMRQWSAGVAIPLASAIRTNGPIRVGIVSAELYNHSVWHAITRGWFTNLDPSRVTLTAFHVGSKTDDETEIARKHAQALHFGERPLADWARLIAASQLDVLIYPSLGMDPTSANLACLRLAPIQMTSWGHPETTGFPTIDHYLSSQAFEPENADQAYSEALIRLPRLGVCYTPIQADPIPPDLTALGLDAARPIILCPGSPFKYAPDFDSVLSEIARRLPNAQLAFFHAKNNSPMTQKLANRLRAHFASEGLNWESHGSFIPFLGRHLFFGLIERADLCLDTIGFSGFNTAMQILGIGTPLIAYEGEFMRGRLASGPLRLLELDELVATTVQEFVAITTRLANDPAERQRIRAKISDRMPMLYNDRDAVLTLQDHLDKLVSAHQASKLSQPAQDRHH